MYDQQPDLANSQGKVDVLTVHEIALVDRSYSREVGNPGQHAATADVIEEFGLVLCVPRVRRGGRTRKSSPGLERATARDLNHVGTLVLKQGRARGSDPGPSCGMHELREGVRSDDDVIVEHPHKVELRL